MISRARVMRWMREMEAERQIQALPRRGDSDVSCRDFDFWAEVVPGHPDYKAKVAEPTMRAIDGLPASYRRLVWVYDYVSVYRAWLRRIPPEVIEQRAERMGGRFVL